MLISYKKAYLLMTLIKMNQIEQNLSNYTKNSLLYSYKKFQTNTMNKVEFNKAVHKYTVFSQQMFLKRKEHKITLQIQ
jgi:hypothetical protein